jgi:ATP-dependent Lon protease
MSENTDKLEGVKSLPLFILPLVLFPYEFLPLHIFEERYRQMLRDIQLGNNLFGVVFYDPQESDDSNLPNIGRVGCVAELRQTETLEDGRSNILTLGVKRFYLDQYIDGFDTYSLGEVSFFEDNEEAIEKLQPIAEKALTLFRRIAKAAHEVSGQRQVLPEIPQAEPQQLSFLIATAFNLPNDLKYELLEMRSTSLRLKKLIGILSQAVSQIEESAMLHKVSKTNGHSKKHIDLN